MEIVRLCVAGTGLRHKRGYDILFNLSCRETTREKERGDSAYFRPRTIPLGKRYVSFTTHAGHARVGNARYAFLLFRQRDPKARLVAR